MGNTTWSGFLSYKAKHTDIDSVLKGSFVPVASFAVKGGAKRIIHLTAADDISLVSEFEQARSFKNITVFLPPTKDFEWHNLYEIAYHNLSFSMTFFASGNVGKAVTNQFTLSCKNATITEQPVKGTDWSYSSILKVNMALPETELLHGSYQESEFVEENW